VAYNDRDELPPVKRQYHQKEVLWVRRVPISDLDIRRLKNLAIAENVRRCRKKKRDKENR
jgi:hypothetical protein